VPEVRTKPALGELEGFSLGSCLLPVDVTGRRCRQGKARLSREVASILERVETGAEGGAADPEVVREGTPAGQLLFDGLPAIAGRGLPAWRPSSGQRGGGVRLKAGRNTRPQGDERLLTHWTRESDKVYNNPRTFWQNTLFSEGAKHDTG